MSADSTVIAGILVPSTSPVFLLIVAVHVLLGLACVLTGLLAMLRVKGPGAHAMNGTGYFRCLAALLVTSTALAIARWPHDNILLALGAGALVLAWGGRAALRSRWRFAVRCHLSGMGASYIVLLTAFYVDNGPQLPLWRDLPTLAYWLAPAMAGIPIIGWTLLRHPLATTDQKSQ